MAETIQITCTACQKKLKVPGTAAGKKVRCKACQAVVAVPAAAKPDLSAEDADAQNPYGVTYESDAPRCPYCAHDVDPPDARICLNCGYDLVERARRASVEVYPRTAADFILWHLPTLGALLGIAALVGGFLYYHYLLPDKLLSEQWATAIKRDRWSYFDADDAEAAGWLFHWAIEVWLIVIGLFLSYRLGRFAFSRLFFHFLPPEKYKLK